VDPARAQSLCNDCYRVVDGQTLDVGIYVAIAMLAALLKQAAEMTPRPKRMSSVFSQSAGAYLDQAIIIASERPPGTLIS
jgi:hypothetical protein